MPSLFASIQFLFGICLALSQPVLLYRAWYRLPFGEFLFLFIMDQFLLFYFFVLPPKSSIGDQVDANELLEDDDSRRWSDEDFASLKNALRDFESIEKNITDDQDLLKQN
jgi:hypothetical protein